MSLRTTRQGAVHGLTGLGACMAVGALVLTAGCGAHLHNQRHKDEMDFKVLPFSNSNALDLDGYDIHRIMEKAGFTPPQIWELGEEVHSGLKELGGVKIGLGKEQIEVVFAIQGYHVWIQTRTRGLFVYDAKSKQFNLGPNAAPVPPGR